eukprot:Gregarina_sp_Pseudo_9__1715@NODE_2163_length_1120_cov_4_957447_g1992_i0_p1_GENE_NODE_2163_length_1120_cov_4_957447_g1992_i0NODE_2163_length_1120_cov_4_957447_g1992_i0_p1_ORF_typecomplete_len208_score26_72_NODE_2163_length_1120_cov_4_957447_g1992_i04371060
MPEISGDDQLLSVPRQTHGILLKKASVRWEIEHQLIELSRADPAIWIVTEFPPSCLVSQFMEMTQVLWVSRPGTDTDLMRYSPSHRDIQVAVLMHKNKRDLESLVEGHPQAPHVYKFVNAHLGILAQMIGSPLEYLEFVIIQRLDARDASEVHSVQVSQPAHLFCFTLLTSKLASLCVCMHEGVCVCVCVCVCGVYSFWSQISRRRR